MERFFGSEFVFNPARWGTSDGYVPYRVFRVYWFAAVSISAYERLSDIKTHTIVRNKEKSSAMLEETISTAFPETDDG